MGAGLRQKCKTRRCGTDVRLARRGNRMQGQDTGVEAWKETLLRELSKEHMFEEGRVGQALFLHGDKVHGTER